jgi:sec-independent protein translocase protein TatC
MAGIFNRGGNDSKAEMSFIDHLEELRKHIIRSVVAVLVGAAVIFIYRNWVFDNIIIGP